MASKYKKRGIIKQILKDHFDGFWYLNDYRFPKEMQKDIQETVQKAIRCGTKDLGYAKYECLGCEGNPKPVFVCFTCKSRFCHGCGKKYTDDWTEKQIERILDVPHRHTVFTVPQEMRKFFFDDRKKLTELSKEVANVFKYWYKNKYKKRELEVGVITVIHTFGRDLNFNPHVHALVTEGAIDKHHEWVKVEYIPYSFLRRAWQKLLMDLLKKWFPNDPKVKRFIDHMYRKYPHGFYVNAEQRMKNAKGAAKYIGRYLARPAIAEYRIVSYDGERVHFWYEDHRTGKRVDEIIPVYRFIYLLLQHIPPKHFRMVGRYGLYSRQKNQQSQKIVDLWNFMATRQLKLSFRQVSKKKKYRDRMIEAFGKDPFLCPHCKCQMELVEIYHPDYGFLYHYMEDFWKAEEKRWGIKIYERKRKTKTG